MQAAQAQEQAQMRGEEGLLVLILGAVMLPRGEEGQEKVWQGRARAPLGTAVKRAL